MSEDEYERGYGHGGEDADKAMDVTNQDAEYQRGYRHGREDALEDNTPEDYELIEYHDPNAPTLEEAINEIQRKTAIEEGVDDFLTDY